MGRQSIGVSPGLCTALNAGGLLCPRRIIGSRAMSGSALSHRLLLVRVAEDEDEDGDNNATFMECVLCAWTL